MARYYSNQRMGPRRGSYRRKGAAVPRPPKEITWGQFATKAWSGVQQIRKLINVETHKFDVNGGTTVNSTGSITHITGVAIGDTLSTRTGSSILDRDLHIRIVWQKGVAATITVTRFIIVQDKQQIADTSPAVLDILNSADVVSHYQPDIEGRFKILKDITTVLDISNVVKAADFKLDLSNVHTGYNGINGSDIQKNGIYILMISNEPTNVPTISWISRFRFYDN